ncbi:MAG: peptidoglycan DD-metalloendopeptidase family protein [Gammaproteobacteria bacterium]|nr:peptidoglycan DD-metalloendopeptidase family protein [Gammaproteobacteria bacterium]
MSVPEQILAEDVGHRRVPGTRRRKLPWLATGMSLPLFSLAFVVPDSGYQDSLRLDMTLTEIKPVFTLPLLFNSSDLVSAGGFGDLAAIDSFNAVSLIVRRGDTLDKLFRGQDLNLADLASILKLAPARENLRILKPGDQIRVRYEADGSVVELTRNIDAFNLLSVTRADEGFDAKVIALDHETRLARSGAEISSSLFGAASQAGVSDRTIMNLAAIFASDVDFMLDLREGDKFNIIYEEKWRDGKKLAEGEILAAEFVNGGRTFRAVRYQAKDGRVSYYTPEGKSMRRAFVRAPLEFSRVSSDFNPRRRHPILNTIRAHKGVDYAAPRGTPVRAPGDGKVVFRGRQGGYGNAIILQHPGGVTTLYGHLSAFARNLRVGQKVSQGTVIGYVGATGLATAPHLHYEYRLNGRHLNPRTVPLPNAAPLASEERERFMRATAPLLRQLDVATPVIAAEPAEAARDRSS